MSARSKDSLKVALVGGGVFNIHALRGYLAKLNEAGVAAKITVDVYESGTVGGQQYTDPADEGYFLLYTPFRMIDAKGEAARWMAENAQSLLAQTRAIKETQNWLKAHEKEFLGKPEEILVAAQNTRVPRFWYGLYLKY